MAIGRGVRILTVAALVLLTFSCKDNPDTDSGTTPTNTGGTGGGTSTAAAIALTANPTTLTFGGTSSIQATVTDSNSNNVPDGTVVQFSVSDTTLGSVNAQATTVSGVATATFTAGSTLAGVATVTATSGSASDTVNITVNAPTTGSIEFVGASPSVIGIKGSGQTETSFVTFLVKDINGGNVVDGISVSFTMSGPNGGEYIGENDATPTATSVSTVDGNAIVTLNSGSVAGPVTIIATVTVGTDTFSSASTPISIGGGVPSMSHFSLAVGRVNLAGLAYVNLQTNVDAFLADRFGNFNVLQNTSVSFYTEAGAVDRSNVTDASGITSVVFRTQDPMPVVFSGANPLSTNSPPLTGDPDNGLSSIIATTRGEECFVDNNGNGVFESGTDTFPASCDISEPFIDADDDSSFDAGSEFYVDANGNGSFDAPNGAWDGDIMIWKTTQIAFTGGPSQIEIEPDPDVTPVAIADGLFQSFNVCVGDGFANSLMGDSEVGVTASVGDLTGGGPLTIPDAAGGPYCFSFLLADADPGDTDPAETSLIEITVTWVVPNTSDLVVTVVKAVSID
jgi:hypothetical protein